MSDFEDDLDPPKRTLLRSLRATTFSGREISIPMFGQLPPYFDRPIKADLQWTPTQQFTDTSGSFVANEPLVDKYVAKKYGDLVSDEQVNRRVLDWLRNFEKHQKDSKKKKKAEGQSNENSHILMLTGPPGSGKSTLIRVVAAACGYHLVELNASEDVSVEKNQLLLHTKLDFEPVFGKRTKPLLVLEEMDGIGTLSDSVVKAVMGMQRRPVIVVVNDAYAPSLKSIKAHSLLVRMPPPTKAKLVQRLKRICDKERINAESGALSEIVEVSRLDMRTALNTLQFLALRQPVTLETVQLMPVGIKNATLGPFDLWEAMFTRTTSLTDMLELMEVFGDNNLLAVGALENMDNFKSPDPTGRRIARILDGLCYTDCSYGELGSLGLAEIPGLHGVSKVSRGQIVFPTRTISLEAQIRKNHQLLMKHHALRQNLELVELYMSPDLSIPSVLAGPAGADLRKRFVAFHKMVKISYKKDSFGHYQSEPDIDGLLDYKESVASLSRFREVIQTELNREDISPKKVTGGDSLTERLQNRNKKLKRKGAVDFWGQTVQTPLSLSADEERPNLYYKYNEGFTNAVRRKVYLERLMTIPILGGA